MPSPDPASLSALATRVLTTADPAGKVAASRAAVLAWRGGALAIGRVAPPDRPSRPERPTLMAPRDMPQRRRAGSLQSRVALLHAIAHIELNAIDLAWDLVARFADRAPDPTWFDDWVTVAGEEAEHFALLSGRLAELGSAYGALPAHDGLWQAASETRENLLERLAVVPLVLEARGLDVTPAMIDRLERVGDPASAAILRRIHRDEIGHVRIGRIWFERLAGAAGFDPATHWAELVARCFHGQLKPPFDHAARLAAGFGPQYWGGAEPATI